MRRDVPSDSPALELVSVMPPIDPLGSVRRFAAMREALREAIEPREGGSGSRRSGRPDDVRYFCEEHGFVQPARAQPLRCPDCGERVSRLGSAASP